MAYNVASVATQPLVVERPATCAAMRNPHNYYLPMDVSSRFGARLRQLRRERNLTQLRMAVEFGIDRTWSAGESPFRCRCWRFWRWA